MTTPDLITMLLLDAFAACESAQSLALDGDAAADVLGQWAGSRKLAVERERMERPGDNGLTITWTLVRVVVRADPQHWVTASRRGDVQPALERACQAITGFDCTDVNGKLDAELSAFPADEDLP